jgi:hypothetical protein
MKLKSSAVALVTLEPDDRDSSCKGLCGCKAAKEWSVPNTCGYFNSSSNSTAEHVLKKGFCTDSSHDEGAY